jgi:hypothetical protein
LVSGRPRFTIGSMVKNMPSSSTGPFCRAAEVQHVRRRVEDTPIPWPQKSRTTLQRCAST